MGTLFHILFFEWKKLRRSNTLKALLLVVFGGRDLQYPFQQFVPAPIVPALPPVITCAMFQT